MRIEYEPKLTIGSCTMIDGDMLIQYETTTVSVDDWRETPIGLINFGFVRIVGHRSVVRKLIIA